MTSIASIPEGTARLSELFSPAGRAVCVRGGGWMEASVTAGAAATLELAVDFSGASDRTAEPGGVFAEASGFEMLDGVAAFFSDPLLSVDWVGFDGFLAVIRFPIIYVTLLKLGSLSI